MKKFMLVCLFLLLSFASHGRHVSAYVVLGEAEIPGMDYQFEWVVKNLKNDQQLIVDCQSFINGIRFGKYEGEVFVSKWEIYLSEEMCEKLIMYGREQFEQNKNFCLIADHLNKDLEVYEEIKFCE